MTLLPSSILRVWKEEMTDTGRGWQLSIGHWVSTGDHLQSHQTLPEQGMQCDRNREAQMQLAEDLIGTSLNWGVKGAQTPCPSGSPIRKRRDTSHCMHTPVPIRFTFPCPDVQAHAGIIQE